MCILDIECGHILCFLTVILFLAVAESAHIKCDHDSDLQTTYSNWLMLPCYSCVRVLDVYLLFRECDGAIF